MYRMEKYFIFYELLENRKIEEFDNEISTLQDELE